MTIAFITGANKGLGFAAAGQLGRSGAKVILGARDAGKGAAAAARLREQDIDAEAVKIDVVDLASVRAAAARVRDEHGQLDILINNAGVLPEATGADRVTGPMDVRMFKDTFDTNVFGAVAVTEAFLPLLRAAPAARIVNVSSTMGSLADQADPQSGYYGMVLPAYQTSKAALNSMTIALSKALAGTAVKVNAVCPGWVQTDLGGADNKAAAPLTPDEGASIITKLALIGDDGPTGGFFDQSGPVRW
ncbi:Oxidoreductase UcpA [Baekduia alba]|uniref:SDR family NAD(P)-dependent oxidoreductase n=1 Tax=Baekduia alba TaxID=2997333 RepID=UPI0023421746|nr:SDR family NAD(P)-dependent oxidoreductase [Baekduia alba]WCB92241.1 Oxidoreductase UcpA [Baekduia alba]